MTNSDPKSPSGLARVVWWCGSIAGIIIAGFTIYDRVFAPSPAKLIVEFFESSSSSLSLDAPINTASDTTEAIPFTLKVDNRGGRAAANIKLYLTYPETILVEAQYEKDSKSTWGSPNEPMTQLALALENMNPGESFLIPVTLRFLLPREVQRLMAHPPVTDTTAAIHGYRVYADVSSETVPSTRTTLEVLLGPCDLLMDRTGDVFWLGHGNGGTKLLKVRDDYPCR